MNAPDDKILDEYLSGSSRLSQHYRELDDVAVPTQLDQRVLTRARDAVADQQSAKTDELERLRQRRKRLMQWSVPAGLAASAVLVVSIVMQSGVQHEVALAPQKPMLQAPPVEMAADAAHRQAEMEKVEIHAKPLREPIQNSPLAVTATHDLAKQSAFVPSVAAPAPTAGNATSRTPQAVQQSTATRAISRSAIEQKSATQQPAQSRDSDLQGSAAESRRAASQADYDVAEVAVTGSAYRPVAGSGPRDTVPGSASAESLPDETVSAPRVLEEPKQWLERIRQLRKAGKTQDADGEWKRFREAYPDYPVAGTDVVKGRR